MDAGAGDEGDLVLEAGRHAAGRDDTAGHFAVLGDKVDWRDLKQKDQSAFQRFWNAFGTQPSRPNASPGWNIEANQADLPTSGQENETHGACS